MTAGFQLAQQQARSYQDYTAVFMDGSARLLVESAAIDTADVVLDLACGTGLVARHAVRFVAGSGRVVGADVNPAMLAVARENGPAMDWVQAPCDDLPFENDTFDTAICQQGFQFFPDPVAAMMELARVLRPGGKAIASVWATPGQNPYIENQLELLAEIDRSLEESVQRATPPHADEFLRSTAAAAGLVEIAVTLLTHEVDVPDFPAWFVAQTGGTPWGPTLAGLPPHQRHDLISAMATRMSPYELPAGGHRIPFRSYRLEARRRS